MASTSIPMPPSLPPNLTPNMPPPPPQTQPAFEENGPMFDSRPEESGCFMVFMNVTNTITQLVLGAVAFSAIFFINNHGGSDQLRQHIYLCVIGYVLLMSQAILSFNPSTSFAHNLKYPTKKAIHWVMQVSGSGLAIVGSIIRLDNVRNNFETTHGILGFIAMLFTSMSLIGGLAKLICGKRMNGLLLSTLHSCFGVLTLIVAFLSLCYGFDLDLYRDDAGDVNADLSIALTVIGLVGVVFMAFVNMTRRICKCM